MNAKDMDEKILEMRCVSKGFPGVRALDSVNFDCFRGEVHALAGENGAGKSTLMKVLAGAYRQDGGEIIFRGKKVFFDSPREAQKQGISIIYQELNLMPELSVADNIFLGREPRNRFGVIDNRSLHRRSRELMEKLKGETLDLSTKAKHLSVAHQQKVEVAKALSLNADIIIMDEPSCLISGKELDALFEIIRSLKDSGKAVIYISHRLEEIFSIADRATILKDGKHVGTVKTRDVNRENLIQMMVGRSFSETFPSRSDAEAGKKIFLEVKGLHKFGHLHDINFSLREGEILGVAGLVGSGRTMLMRCIFGAESVDGGELLFKGQSIKRPSPKSSIRKGIGFVTEDRKMEGIVPNLPVRVNLTLPIVDAIHKCGFLLAKKEKSICREAIKSFNIRTPNIEQEIQFLSGGNQQKVILAKWLNAGPELIIMDEPTRGIDVGAKAEIYDMMRRLADQGTAILMVSSELPEIIGMSDRIIVMYEGQIMGEIASGEATEEQILRLATGENGAKTEEVVA